MIMVNFFISILDRSYVNVKMFYVEGKEKFSFKNFVFFCCNKTNEVKNKGINIESEFDNGIKVKYEVRFKTYFRSLKASYKFITKFIANLIMLEINLTNLKLLMIYCLK